ncbi:muscular LMNA-interacting protein isoform X2 [Brienomyrus brachyistius]|uniref:muscular LMNA-interacting protein isoform X2 n=1 Tax=Brienomyrus brachyistius TaxID=42636 RepID=UPI0020B3288F|nr:muscular LMNA-interacting protein isoform X2 [Brienomyrus brachyistius]
MALDSREPLSGSGRDGPQKVSSDVLPSQLQPFTFVPVLKKLPIKSRILPRGQIRDPSATSTEQCSGGQEADQSMSDGMFRAEMVFIGDSDEGDAGAARTQRVPDELSVKGEAPAPYKIKTGYKVLAAIPTNTILLEQQAVDDHVENQERPGDRADNGEESHPEICSPAQLRQESEELYAAIDEVLENTMPTRRCRSVPVALTKPLSPEPSKPFTLLPRPVGRETKYAFSYTQQGSPLERNLTKPGVIRPVGAVTKTPEADNNAEFQPNPFRKYLPETSMGKQLEPIPSCPGLAGARGTEGGISPAKGTQVPEESGEALAGRRTPILRITKEDGSDIQTVLADSSEYPDAPASTLLGTQNETHI